MTAIGSHTAAQSKSPTAALDPVFDQHDCDGECGGRSPIATNDSGPAHRGEPIPSVKRKGHASLSGPGDPSFDPLLLEGQPILEFATLLIDMHTESAPEIPQLIESEVAIATLESDESSLKLPIELPAMAHHSLIGSPTLQSWQGKTTESAIKSAFESVSRRLVPTSTRSQVDKLTPTEFESPFSQPEFHSGESLFVVASPLMTNHEYESTFEPLPYPIESFSSPVNSWSGGSSQPIESFSLNATRSVGQQSAHVSLVTHETRVIDSVLHQVMETIVTESVSLGGNNSRHLSIQIHPAELGQLEIVIGSTGDVLKAEIVASETVTSELLIREKSHLINALREQGIDLTDVDISHRDPRDQDQQQFQSSYQNFADRALQDRNGNSSSESNRPQKQNLRSASLVDVIA